MTAQLVYSGAVTLVGGGEVGADDIELARRHAPQLLAADSGAAAVLAAGLLPEAVIGDLDSLPVELRAKLPADLIYRVTEQDSSDFDKSLRMIQAPLVLAVGFTGGRLDHGLAAFGTICRFDSPFSVMLGAQDIAFRAPRRLFLDLPTGLRMSLFPMGDAQGCSTGLHWPLDGVKFSPVGRNGLSNRTTGPVSLTIDGPMIVILPRSSLDRVVPQLLTQMTGV